MCLSPGYFHLLFFGHWKFRIHCTFKSLNLLALTLRSLVLTFSTKEELKNVNSITEIVPKKEAKNTKQHISYDCHRWNSMEFDSLTFSSSSICWCTGGVGIVQHFAFGCSFSFVHFLTSATQTVPFLPSSLSKISFSIFTSTYNVSFVWFLFSIDCHFDVYLHNNIRQELVPWGLWKTQHS